MTARKTALIAGLSLCAGFVGGAWFLSSDLAIRKILVPSVPPFTAPAAPVAKAASPSSTPPPPRTPAVAVPREALFSGGWGGLYPPPGRFDLLPSPGCDWVIEPRPFQAGMTWHLNSEEQVVAGDSTTGGDGDGLRFLLIHSTRDATSGLPLRPVFFDEAARRHVARSSGASSHRGPGGYFAMEKFRLDPRRDIPPEKVAFFGVERVRPEAAGLVVEGARRAAEAWGVATLPFPELGRPYPFDLPAVEGGRVRSADLRGKAVVVAVWGPGASRMVLIALKGLREDYMAEQVALVAVSFDGSADDARRDLAEVGVDGTLVVVPNDAATRRIWIEAAGLDPIPLLYLVDRQGVLRASCDPLRLKDRVDDLMGRARPRPRLPEVVTVGGGMKPPAAASPPPARPRTAIP